MTQGALPAAERLGRVHGAPQAAAQPPRGQEAQQERDPEALHQVGGGQGGGTGAQVHPAAGGRPPVAGRAGGEGAGALGQTGSRGLFTEGNVQSEEGKAIGGSFDPLGMGPLL